LVRHLPNRFKPVKRDSIRQLREILDKVGMKGLEQTVTVGKVWEAIDEDGNVKPEHMRGDVIELFRGLEAG
jgi:hypothetical protein